MTAATTEHFALRAALNRYWWLLLGRHKLSLVCNYVTAHRQQLLPLPWPEQEFLQLDPAPSSNLRNRVAHHLHRGWPAAHNTCKLPYISFTNPGLT